MLDLVGEEEIGLWPSKLYSKLFLKQHRIHRLFSISTENVNDISVSVYPKPFSIQTTTHIGKNNETSTSLNNIEMQGYPFLKDMYRDNYFPNFLVDKLKNLLIELCADLEKEVNSTKLKRINLN